MEDVIRTFIAIKITPGEKLLNIVSELKANLNEENIKWTNEKNFHLTLHFIGNTTKEQVKNTGELLQNICTHFSPFEINIKGTGVFKYRQQPRVLFAGIEKSYELQKIANEITGINNRTYKFNPHLTLARIKFIKNKNSFYKQINSFEKTQIQKTLVTEIIFYRSILNPEGPLYLPLKTISLTRQEI